ncbi:hypothetical protein GQ53DRAFT_747882 [Thozetella sp. PMI_491]|nr:hypothetical protein GQ53DRAFT_747882 [Thozetella sp. PMI_491]
MAEVEEPQFNSLAERIAALNQQRNFQAPPSGVAKRPPPPPPPNRAATTQGLIKQAQSVAADERSPSLPPRPTRPTRAAADKVPPTLPRRTTAAADDEYKPTTTPSGRTLAPPPLPRNSQQQTSPVLPPRRPSTQTLSTRRNSNSSDVSYLSTVSNLSLSQTVSPATSVGGDAQPLRKLPPALGEAKLPPLPPSRRDLEAKAKEAAEQEAIAQAKRAVVPPPRPTPSSRASEPARPSLPPRLPSRPVKSPSVQGSEERAPALPSRRLPPPPSAFQAKSALESGFGARPKPTDNAPPPVPMSSRPSFAQIEASSSVAATAARPASTPPSGGCLVCRDFSGPDNVAAQYPVHILPREDPIGYLAHVLCDPFPSHTDKARAIFTWLHHNIAYNVKDFMAGTIPRGETAEDTIFSGLAVCAGYANVYEEIADRAGMRCVVVCGHGKGFGYQGVKPGSPPPPPNPTGHAWNAVQIDGGEWKLLDACWGAGYVNSQEYTKKFNPAMFCMSNEDFGLKHFPEDSDHFYRKDGRIPSWEEYFLGPEKGEKATWYGSAAEDGLSEATFEPRGKYISVHSGEVVRFQVSKVCEHWDPIKNGVGPSRLLLIKLNGQNGRKDDYVPLDSDGFWWWVDIPARDLGAPGQTLSLYGLDTFEGKTGRGVSKQLFMRKKGRVAMSWVGVAAWELV